MWMVSKFNLMFSSFNKSVPMVPSFFLVIPNVDRLIFQNSFTVPKMWHQNKHLPCEMDFF